MKQLLIASFICFLFACNNNKQYIDYVPTDDSIKPDALTEQELSKIRKQSPIAEAHLTIRALGVSPTRVYLTPGGDKGVFIPDAAPFNTDTFVLSKKYGKYSYVYIGNWSGTPTKNKVIINEGGQVVLGGIQLGNCQYVKVSGSGTEDKYGFRMSQDGASTVGGTIQGYVKCIEFERCAIDTNGYGFWAKNEHYCEDAALIKKYKSTLEAWVIDSITIHDCYLANIKQHGSYFGATEQTNKTRPSLCNGVNVFLNPSKLGHFKIYNNIVRNCGKNGFMLCGAENGMSEIYNNDIQNTGTDGLQDQGAGIQLGGFTNAYVHDNKIDKTWLWGIRSFGGDSVRIENNTVSNQGISWAQCICIGVESSFTRKMTFTIKGNTLTKPGSGVPEIQVYNYSGFNTDNIICNNTGKFQVEDKVKYTEDCKGEKPIPPNKKVPMYILYSDSTWSTVK